LVADYFLRAGAPSEAKRHSVFLFAKTDLARWGKVIRQGNIKPE
jgi:hypothetical protein